MPLPDKARSRAVLIGVSSYHSDALPNLPSVANNLAALRVALTEPEHGSFAPDRCVVIENPADQSQVARQLADVAAAAEDVLLIYYTGHGLVGTRRQDLFLGLSATDPARPQYSALPFAWIRDELLDSTATTKVLILDCCFSGLAVDGFLADQGALVDGQVSVRGTYTLAATPAYMAALAPPGAEYTAFSGELLALLRDGVPAGPPELDLDLIYQRLARRMREEGWPIPKQYGTDNVLRLALARNPAHAPPPEPAVREPVAPSVRTAAVEGRKPRLGLAVIGHAGHGKTTLTAAISKVLHDEDTLDEITLDEIRAAYRDTVHHSLSISFPISLAHVEYETARTRFDHVDFHHHADYVTGMLTGVVRPDVALLVVSVLDGPLPQTLMQLQLARQAGVPSVVVALTMVDEADDEQLTELVELETRDLLSANGYPAVAPMVRVSARGALDGEPRWVRSVRDLVTAVEQYVSDPLAVADLPFLLAVEDVLSIAGGGVVVTGRVERGRVSRGADAEVVGVGDRLVRTVVASVEKSHGPLDVAGPGENVRLLLQGLRPEDVRRGEVVASPGSVSAPRTRFKARVSFRRGNSPSQAEFHFYTVGVQGSVGYLPDKDWDSRYGSRVGVRLARPVAMAVGDRFTVRREGNTVGFGLVTEVAT